MLLLAVSGCWLVLLCKGIYHQQRQRQEQRGQGWKLLLVGLQEPTAAAAAGGHSQVCRGPSQRRLLLVVTAQPVAVQQAAVAAAGARSQRCLERLLQLVLLLVAGALSPAAGGSLPLLMQGCTHLVYKDPPPHQAHTPL
jgi:hypothetical protein